MLQMPAECAHKLIKYGLSFTSAYRRRLAEHAVRCLQINAKDSVFGSAFQHYSSKDNPTEHTSTDLGQFYRVPQKHCKEMFDSQVPSLLRHEFLILSKTFGEMVFMIREPALEVMQFLRCANINKPKANVILYGRTGNGKSITLAHVIHYAYSLSDWLIVCLPYARKLNHSKGVELNSATMSKRNPGFLDVPIHAVQWLQMFKTNNFSLLSDNVTLERYEWSKRDIFDKGTTLLEIVDFGIARGPFACDVVDVLLKEVKEQASREHFKLLVAIKAINAFVEDTRHKKPPSGDKLLMYHATELSLVRSFRELVESDWTNGVVVSSVNMRLDAEHERFAKITTPDVDYPLKLLTRDFFEDLDPCVPIHVERYTDTECQRCLEYYMSKGWIQNPLALSESGQKELMFVSCGNPFLLERTCAAS